MRLNPMYDEENINELFLSNRELVIKQLKKIPIYCGVEPVISGLTGWVFEQTIQYCIKRELEIHNLSAEFFEQSKLDRRIKADLRVGNTAIEIKSAGVFSVNEIEKYARYRKLANKLGLTYLFLTRHECTKYESKLISKLGVENTFFLLQNKGEWKRFINRIFKLL